MFADALTGGDMKKLEAGMKKGTFKSHDLLKVAAHMKDLVDAKQLEEMMKTPEKQVIRLKNSWGSLITALNQSGLWDIISEGIETVTKAIQDLTPHIKDLSQLFKNFVGILDTLKYLLPIIWGYFKISGIMAAATGITTLAGAFKMLGAAMMRTLVIPALIVAGLFLISDAIESIKGKDGLLMEASRKGGMLGMFAEGILQATRLMQILGIIDKSQEQKNNEVIAGQAVAQSGLVEVLSGIQKNPKMAGGAEALNQSLMGLVGHSSNMTPEMKHKMAERVRRIATPEMLQYRAIPSLLKQLDAGYVDNQVNFGSRSQNFNAAGGLSAPQTISVTIQNTEPNVSKEWLSGIFPDLLTQAVQKEWSMFPNQSSRNF